MVYEIEICHECSILKMDCVAFRVDLQDNSEVFHHIMVYEKYGLRKNRL